VAGNGAGIRGMSGASRGRTGSATIWEEVGVGEPEAVSIAWRKSSRSGGDEPNCVEVAFVDDDAVLVRDSKDPEGALLRFTRGEWVAFLGGVRNKEFELPE
jgi:Domain of unknown function (DUF397)